MFNFSSCNKPNILRLNPKEVLNSSISNKNCKQNNKDLTKALDDDEINEFSNNLEIIDYPYSVNNNDDTTIKMNSTNKNKNTINKISKDELIDTSSNNSSIIINNEDTLQKNKILLNNYYINCKIINVNNINNIKNKDIKDNTNNKFNKNDRIKINSNMVGVKVEYPYPESISNLPYEINNIISNQICQTNVIEKELPKNLKINLKPNKFICINKKGNCRKKRNEAIKSTKILVPNNSEIGKILNNCNSKVYNTKQIYMNKSYNNFKENKIYKEKLKYLMNKKIDSSLNKTNKYTKNRNLMKELNIKRNKTCRRTKELIKMKKINYNNNIIKNKPKYPSILGEKNLLLNKIIQKIDKLKTTDPNSKNEEAINCQRKTKNIKKKIENRKKYFNPFVTIDSNFY